MESREKIRSILFALIITSLLCLPSGYFIIATICEHVELPSVSSFERRSYTELPTSNRKMLFLSGEYQSTFDRWVADHVPFRNHVLLLDAWPQRIMIEAANAPFGYDAYPAFFGSDTVIAPEDNLITAQVREAKAGDAETAKVWMQTLETAVAQHPDTHFVFQVVGHPTLSSLNPAACYVSYPLLDDEWAGEHLAITTDYANLDLLSFPIKTRQDYVNGHFSTEEHWTLDRALEAYNQVADVLGWVVDESSCEDMVTVSQEWYGVSACTGRDFEYSSDLMDLPRDFSNITLQLPGKRDEYLCDTDEPRDDLDLYQSYYPNIQNSADNSTQNNGKTCLVIGTSYIAALVNHISCNYEHVDFITPANIATDTSFEGYLSRNYDDVVVQFLASTPYSLLGRSPAFLGTANE